MWINPLYDTDALSEVRQLIAANSLATLVVENPLAAAHVPLLLEDAKEGVVLSGHIAKADPVERALHDGGDVLTIFHGARAYVSAGWYEEAGLPTYNFSVAHLSGSVILMEKEELRAHLIKLIRVEEERKDPAGDGPWELDETGSQRMEKLLPAVSGFWIRVTIDQAKAKLGQNRTGEDRTSTREHLREATGTEPREVADRMGDLATAPDPRRVGH